MLNIRNEQNQVFSEDNHQRFVETMLRYLEGAYPTQFAALGREEVVSTIELGIEVAASYDVKVERPVGYYIDLMFQLGVDFDDWKELAWAREILEDEDLTGAEKMGRIRHELELT